MALTPESGASLKSFLFGIYITLTIPYVITSTNFRFWSLFGVVFFVVLGLLLLMHSFSLFLFKIAIRAYGLGLVFGLAVDLTMSHLSFRLYGWHLMALCFFHWSEFFVTSVANPDNVSIDSYMLDHSLEYHLASLASLVEFFIEWYFFPPMACPAYIWNILGLIMVLCGELLRKTAMWTAKSNFNHYVQYEKHESHQLVKDGVYSFFRHPSYVGWFYWSVGTQIMICNPICAVAYAYVSWKFFNDRIMNEEYTLINFFGHEYIKYQREVPVGIPFIKGFTNT